MCNISIYQILLSFNALLYEEFSHRDETEASLLYFFAAFYIAGLNIRLLERKPLYYIFLRLSISLA